VKWYRKAADQGDVNAQYNLGQCYREARGLRKDYAEAVKWYRRAAEQGDAGAQYELGACYANGEGVSGMVDAYKWSSLAAAQGHEAATDAKGKIAKRMSRVEIEEGQRRVAAFVAKKEGINADSPR